MSPAARRAKGRAGGGGFGRFRDGGPLHRTPAPLKPSGPETAGPKSRREDQPNARKGSGAERGLTPRPGPPRPPAAPPATTAPADADLNVIGGEEDTPLDFNGGEKKALVQEILGELRQKGAEIQEDSWMYEQPRFQRLK